MAPRAADDGRSRRRSRRATIIAIAVGIVALFVILLMAAPAMAA